MLTPKYNSTQHKEHAHLGPAMTATAVLVRGSESSDFVLVLRQSRVEDGDNQVFHVGKNQLFLQGKEYPYRVQVNIANKST